MSNAYRRNLAVDDYEPSMNQTCDLIYRQQFNFHNQQLQFIGQRLERIGGGDAHQGTVAHDPSVRSAQWPAESGWRDLDPHEGHLPATTTLTWYVSRDLTNGSFTYKETDSIPCLGTGPCPKNGYSSHFGTELCTCFSSVWTFWII